MLKLKKLQILGFKSFCDRAEIKFHGDGIAAIVGPNGCGKSNIADAISWVLGEQSAKTLRGSRMEDVIFAGTRERKPTGMAEVSLTLIDPEVYEGADSSEETQVEISDDLPDTDWDEAELRANASADTERHIEEVQPGQGEDQTDFVLLKIRRRQFKNTQFKAGQIVVTRRLFRSGESEYLLNGRLCRLRDIQDMFMGTGLGPESYALIEQGRIGQILSSKPTDRRSIIEEAAGITKFKTKKRLAEARLEESRQNLARINDIFDEVARQMNSLRRQASKAERYAKLRDEMRAKLRLVLASKFAQWERDKKNVEQQLQALASEMRLKSEAVQQTESGHAEHTQRGYEIENELRQNRERINEIAREIDRAESRRRHNEDRCRELSSRAATAESDLARTAENLSALEHERDSNRQVLDSAAADLAAAQEKATASQREATSSANQLAEVDRRQEERRVAVMEILSAASGVRNQTNQAEERTAALERESQRLLNELSAAKMQLETFTAKCDVSRSEFESVRQRATALDTRIADARRQLEQKRSAETACKRRLDSVRAEHATALGKKASLEAMVAEHGYSTDSVRRLFQSGALEGRLAPVGVLADFLEVEDRYEHVVEDFLRDELNYIVVKSWDAADEGLRLLRTDVDGRATFLVHPEDSQAKFSFLVDEAARATAPRRESVVPVKNCIRVLNGFGKSLEVILPKLRDGYIVPDPAVARELALENPHAFFLSQSGESFHNVTVTGGRQRSEGPLSMKRELRDLLRQMSELERTLAAEKKQVTLLEREITALASLLVALETAKRELDKKALTSEHGLQQLEAEIARGSERRFTFEQELNRIAGERAEQEASISTSRQELTGLEQRRSELESELTLAQESLGSLRTARDAAVQRASEMLAQVAALEERRRSAAAATERIETMVTEVSARVTTLRSQIEQAANEQQQSLAENLELSRQVLALASERTAVQARETDLKSGSENLRAQLTQLENELRAARLALDQARDQRAEVGATAAKLESDGHYLAESCMNELGLSSHELRGETERFLVADEQLAQEDAACREMRQRLEAMGPVNMMALEEYQETTQRHEFLTTQRKDLLESIENTQNTIREIDTISRQKFQEAFDRINENFHMTFRKLFGGGQAFMRLTDEANAAESGIDVVASPPGKKLQNVLLLSGGEKAMTALALLVGIFQYQPSPFCILDEVDAPLDEANIGRFTDLVREMSIQTQFVLITHSKKTMSIAPVIYGVTMQEPGVSKLVSVRLETAAAQIARA